MMISLLIPICAVVRISRRSITHRYGPSCSTRWHRHPHHKNCHNSCHHKHPDDQVPHVNITFHRLADENFKPDSELYLESLGIIG